MSDHPDIPPEEQPDELPTVAEYPETLNLNDTAQQRRQRKRVDTERDLDAKFWRDVFATTVGRRCMWSLLRAAQPDGDPFTPPFPCGPNGFPQPEATWLRAGQYALGQNYWQQWLSYSPDGALLMLQENSPVFARWRKKPRD